MDAKRFEELFGGTGEDVLAGNVVDEVRRQLERTNRHWYYDISGDGTCYVASGTRHGVGFARAEVTVDEGGMAEVVIRTGQRVAPDRERALRKLLRHYSSAYRVEGMTVEDGQVVYRCQPFDPLRFSRGVDYVVGLGFAMIHSFAGVSLALDAGVEPWRLVDYRDRPSLSSRPPFSDDDDDNDDDGGMTLDDSSLPGIADVVQRLRSHLLGVGEGE